MNRLLSFFTAIACVLTSSQVRSQTLSHQAERLLIKDFQVIMEDNTNPYRDINIKELIKIGVRGNYEVITSQYADSLPKKYELTGTINEFNKSISITAQLLDIKQDTAIRIVSKPCPDSDILCALVDFNKKLNKILNKVSLKRVVLLPFANTGKVNKRDLDDFNFLLQYDLLTIGNKKWELEIDDSTNCDIGIVGILTKDENQLRASFTFGMRKFDAKAFSFNVRATSIMDLEYLTLKSIRKWLTLLSETSDTAFASVFNVPDTTYQGYLRRAKAATDTAFQKHTLLGLALNKNPRGYEALYLLGRLELSELNCEDAINYFAEAAKYAPSNDTISFYNAMAHICTDNYDNSMQILLKIESRDANFPGLYKQLATVSSIVRPDLFEHYGRLNLVKAKTRPDSADAYYLLGKLYSDRYSFKPYLDNSLDSAFIYLHKSDSLGNNSPELKSELSQAYAYLGDRASFQGFADQAIKYYQKAIKILNNFFTYSAFKRYYIRTGQLDVAALMVEEAMKDSVLYKNDKYVAYYDHAVALRAAARRADTSLADTLLLEALKFYEIYDSLKPAKTGSFKNTVGLTFLDAGQYAKAEKFYREAISLPDPEPYYFLNLAEVLIIQNKPTEVLATLDTLKKIFSMRLPTGNNIIADYLSICARYLINPVASYYQQDIQNLSDPNNYDQPYQPYFTSNWSFIAFREWLNNTSPDPNTKQFLDPNTKQFLSDLTDKVDKQLRGD